MSRPLGGVSGVLLVLVTILVLGFILAPLVVTVATAVSETAYVVFPPRGFTLKWFAKALHDEDFLAALWLSTTLALAATTGALMLGVPAAFALVRGEFGGRAALTSLLLSPLIFPALITGVALLQLFSTLHFNNSAVNLLIGHVLVTTPYVVRTTAASLSLIDRNLEDAARTLGAGQARIFRRIIVPQIAPGLAAGALFAFMVSFDNFPISLWLADAQNNPVPLLIFQMIANVFEPTVAAISTLMILFAVAVVLLLERIGGLNRAMAM